MHEKTFKTWPKVLSVDGRVRIDAFLQHHGGPAMREEFEGDSQEHSKGWSEVHAADGYTLRCDWSSMGEEIYMDFLELPPVASAACPEKPETR